MERDDGLRFNWQPLVQMNNNNNNNSSSNSGSGSGGVDQLATAATFLNLNWDQSYTEQAANFESALSSLVSSPTSSSAVAPCSDTCCYTTPLNSPPQQQQQQQFMPFAADPGFVERAARFSCFGAGEVGKLSRVSSSKSLKSNVKESSNYDYVGGGKEIVNPMQTEEGGPEIGGAGGGQLDIMSMMMMMTMMRSGGSNAPEDSAGSGRERMAVSGGEGNVRKRKAKAKNTPKMANEENSNAKRCKSSEGDGADTGKLQKVEQNGESSAQKQSKDKDEKKEKDNDVKPTEPPKQDYIHVRARRGQATDSHSLAERVRREKIGERMKFLQDLVPGCNKVTGKAVMLDEIINYVQSLQRQVEFLSMKLATVNPRLDFNADGLLSKDTQQPASGLMSSSHLSFPLDQASSAAFSYSKQPQGQGQGPPHPTLQSFLTNGGMETQCSVNPLDNGLRRSLNMHLPPLDSSFMDAASQLGPFWEDDLLSVVQMGFGQQNQLEIISSSHNLQGTLPTNHMKIEL